MSRADAIQVLLALQGVQTVFLVLLLLLFYLRMRREAYLLWWSYAWTAYLAYLVIGYVTLELGSASFLAKSLLLVTTAAGLLQACLLALGAWAVPRHGELREPRTVRWWPWLAGTVILSAVVYSLSEPVATEAGTSSYVLRSVIRAVTLTLAYGFCAVEFYRWWRSARSQGARLTAYACGASGIVAILGTLRFWHTPSSPYPWMVPVAESACLAGIATGIVLLLLDEHRRTEKARLESEARFGGVAESLAEGVIITSPEDKILYANKGFLRLAGYERKDVIGQPAYRLLHAPTHWEFLWQKNRERLGGKSERYEIEIRRKSGSFFPAEVSAAPYRDSAGAVVGILNVISDITDRRAAEQALRESEDRYRTVAQTATDAILTIDADSRILFANPAAERIFGYSISELLGGDLTRLMPEYLRHLHKLSLARYVQTSQRHMSWDGVPLPGLHKKGHEIALEVSFSEIVKDGRHFFTGIIRDVTERKQAATLQNAVFKIAEAPSRCSTLEELYAAVHQIIQEVMPARNFYIALYDEKRNLISFPYFVDEQDAPDPARKPRRGNTEYVLRAGKSLLSTAAVHAELERQGEVELIGPMSPIWLGVPLKVGEKTIGVMTVQHYTDPNAYGQREQRMLEFVSSQVAKAIAWKQAEKALRQSEAKFATAFHASPDAMMINSLDEGRYIEVNEGFEALTGYTREEAIGRTSLELGFWDAAARQQFVEALRREGRVRDYVATFRKKSGEHYVSLLSSELIELRGQACVLTTERDITERKKMEEALRASEEKFSRAFRSSPDAMILSRLKDGVFLEVNEGFLELSGYTRDEVIGRSSLDLNMWSRAETRNAIVQGLRESGSVRNVEAEFRDKGGHAHVGLVSAELMDFGGEACMLAVTRDITERKQMEEAVRLSEEKFSKAFHSSPDAMVISNMAESRFLEVNESFLRLTGYAREAVIGRTSNDLRLWLDPDQRVRISHAVRAASAVRNEEFQLRTCAGEILICLLSVDEVELGGQPCFLNVIRDITDRKQMEEALRYSEERYRELFENANDIVYTHDLTGNFTSLNRAGERLTGYSSEEALRLNIAGILSPEQLEFARRMVEQKIEGKAPTTYELEIRRKDGGELTLEVSTRLIYHDGAPIGIQGIARDITERKRAEGERLRYLRIQTALGQASRALLSTLDPDQLLEKILEVALASLPAATKGSFLSWDEQAVALQVRLTRGYTDPRVAQATFVRSGFCFKAAVSRTPMIIEDAQAEAETRYAGDVPEMRAIRSALVAPLIARERLLGVLSLDADVPRAFDDEDKDLLIALAGHASLALENAHLYGQVEESREHYRIVSDLVSDWAYSTRVEPDARPVNEWITEAFTRTTGYTAEELDSIGGWMEIVYLEDRQIQQVRYEKLLRGESDVSEMRIRAKNGEIRWIRDYARPEWDPQHRRVIRFYGAAQDITERRTLEEQLRQAQKMEAVGRLAGGVAHDFNNLLMVIRGYTELLIEQLPGESPLLRSATQIEKASDRAAALTQQLLAFSRKQVLTLQTLNLNTVLTGVDKMLRRVIGEDIELVCKLAETLGYVKADPGQVEQVLLNLAVNARDAMPSGGKLTLETANTHMDEAFVRANRGAIPGPYVMLAVTDTGVGMDARTKARVFEPFFTTKEKGKGTGLGLATVYGIVKQSNGYIAVESEPAKGARFSIYLPRVEPAVETPQDLAAVPGLQRGRETVLVVEDQDEVRDLAIEFLRSQGYAVLQASNGAEALEIAGRHPGRIDLLMTDVVMPGISGSELAQRLIASRPDTRVLYVSGYTEEAIGQHGVLDKGTEFLAKPFSRDALARKLREILDSASPAAQPR
ncbi:MAG: PAS domain S-box protein [Candidatus Acidiferrales bacterium]